MLEETGRSLLKHRGIPCLEEGFKQTLPSMEDGGKNLSLAELQGGNTGMGFLLEVGCSHLFSGEVCGHLELAQVNAGLRLSLQRVRGNLFIPTLLGLLYSAHIRPHEIIYWKLSPFSSAHMAPFSSPPAHVEID